jgi:hypothetical protein
MSIRNLTLSGMEGATLGLQRSASTNCTAACSEAFRATLNLCKDPGISLGTRRNVGCLVVLATSMNVWRTVCLPVCLLACLSVCQYCIHRSKPIRLSPFFPVCVNNCISIYGMSRPRTLFLDSFILLLGHNHYMFRLSFVSAIIRWQ